MKRVYKSFSNKQCEFTRSSKENDLYVELEAFFDPIYVFNRLDKWLALDKFCLDVDTFIQNLSLEFNHLLEGCEFLF